MKNVLHTDPQRSALMGRVRQKKTKSEEEVGKALRRMGLAYRRNVRGLPGSPDFANKTRRWAIFVNGCFWHHHKNCARATMPKRNRFFWESKFLTNRKRDATNIRALRQTGYNAKIIWECECLSEARLVARLNQIFERQNPRNLVV